MKRVWCFFALLSAFLLCAAAGSAESAPVDEAHFPDRWFRDYVLMNIDQDGDGVLSQAEARAVTEIDVSYENIYNMKGVECFPSLETLICRNLYIREMDLSGNPGLKTLDIAYCGGLTAIDLGCCPELIRLTCEYSALQSLDLSGCGKLVSVYAPGSQLESVIFGSQPSIESLWLNGTKIASLDVSGFPRLTQLSCSVSPNLTSLSASGCKALKELYCSRCQLTRLNVNACPQLSTLECDNNQLSALSLSSCTSLTKLNCAYNRLAALDLSGCSALTDCQLYQNEPAIGTTDGSVNLRNLPGFDVSKAVFEESPYLSLNGSILTVEYEGAYNYTYDCGNGQKMDNILNVRFRLPGLDGVPVNADNFPDAAFREKVSSFADLDQNGVLSKEEIERITFFGVTDENTASIQGIEYFTRLEHLSIECIAAETLSLSGLPHLTFLSCGGCGLTSLSVSGCKMLDRVDCDENRLTNLTLKDCEKLTSLNCNYNLLASLDLSGLPSLTYLRCANNPLSALDVSACAKLREAHCEDCLLSRLTLGQNRELTALYCQNNGIRTLNLSGCSGLLNLNCGNNLLTALDVSVTPLLQVLECGYNAISSLNVSACRDLGVLTCWGNQLTALDLTANTNLSSVNCAFNQLACLNMGHLPLNDLVCNGNVRAITLNDSFLYLPNLPGFKPGKASNWNGGYVRNDTLYVQGSGRVTYQYDIGYDIKVEFALDIALASQQEAGIPIDEEHFPDAAFRSYVTSVIDSDASGTLSEAERNAVEALDLGDMGISSLAGLQHFPRLQGLSCANNQLTSLDLSGNAAIIVLNCSGNHLTALDVSALSGLTAFSCAQNSLTALNLSGNPALQILSCGGNRLTSLDISGNGALAGLECSGNRLAVTADQGKFDLSGLPGFDPARASQWTGANAAGSVLTIRESGPVTYLYDCGRDVQIQFALDVTVTNLPAFDPAEELRNKPGNVNGDEAGTVDGRDVIRLARFLAGDGVQINEKAADVNADGTVDGRDLIRLARYLAGDGVELKQAP